MMKIALFCFSGTGNTRFVAEKITNLFRIGNDCSLFSLEKHLDDASSIIASADLVGLGYPIYGSSVPDIVRDFIDRLERFDKPAFVFCTQLMYSGDGAAYGGRLLEKKGFRPLWQEHFNMPNNITDLAFLTRKKPPRYGAISFRVERKAKVFVARILSGRPKKKGSNFFSLLLGLVQRVPYEKLEENAVKDAIRIKHDKCTRCGRCVSLCPRQNLELKQGRIEVGDHCTICYRCVNHCPERAMYVLSKKGVRNPYHGPEANFRIQRVMRDDITD